MFKKIALWVAVLLLASLAFMICDAVGYKRGYDFVKRRYAYVYAVPIYEHFKLGDVEGAVREGLIAEDAVAVARDTQRLYGKVLSYEIVSFYDADSEIDKSIELRVTREKGVRHESLSTWIPRAQARSMTSDEPSAYDR